MALPWSEKVLVIAEIGCNHEGDLGAARRLIDAAAAAGADAAKFQSFVVEEMATEALPKAAYQVAATGTRESQFDRLRRVQLSEAAHRDLQSHCAGRGVRFCSSAFDHSSLRLLDALDVPFFKVPSGEITNLPLLREMGGLGRPVILSTGMADLFEVERAIEALGGARPDRLALLHCVSAYPAPWREANLRAIGTLQRTFGLPVGFSDHSTGTRLVAAAVALGAVIIEKHLTLDRAAAGGDHRASLEPAAFAELVRTVRGIEAALGTGDKRCLPIERDVRSVSRKSVVAARAIAAGETIGRDMLALKRPGNGLEPAYLDALVGATAARAIPADATVVREDVAGVLVLPGGAGAASDPARLAGAIVRSPATIRAAMQQIDRSGLRGVFVCDDEGELQGVVMDADIRRALLANANVEASIKTIMKTAVFTLAASMAPASRRVALLESGKLLAPVVDADRRVVDVLSINDVTPVLAPLAASVAGGVVPPQRVLVIGGAGYIGSVLVEKLLRQNYRVRVLDLLLYGKDSARTLQQMPGQENLEFVRGDCRDEGTILAALTGADAVVHLGEIVGDPACAINEAFTIDTNYAATQMIVDHAARLGIRRFVFTSSCSVYGQNDHEVDEASPLNPVSLYARCKIESERAILSHGADRLNATILRLATVHGPSHRQRLDLVVNYLAVRAAAERHIQIFGGQQWRPFVSVRDVCRAVMDVLHASAPLVRGQVFNVGDSRENYQLESIGAAVGEAIPHVRVEVVADQRDPRNYRVSFDRIRQTLGFTAEYTVGDSIRELAGAYREGRILADYNDPRYHNLRSLKEQVV